MRADEWTDMELVKLLAKAMDEGECSIGNDLKFMRGDKVLEMNQDDFIGYVSPEAEMRDMKEDPKNVVFLVDCSDYDSYMFSTFHDVIEALEAIEEKSSPCDECDDYEDEYPLLNGWLFRDDEIFEKTFTDMDSLIEYLMESELERPYDRYWYGCFENFDGKTYTADDVLDDIHPDWFEDGQSVVLYIFDRDITNSDEEENE